jgi:uncharacterized protein (TIGR04255 family)
MRWRPAHEDHAIERVAVTLQFSEAIAQKAWEPLLAAATAEALKKGFLAVGDNIQLTLQSRNLVNIGNTPPSGRNFQLNLGSGVQEEIQIHRSQFLFATTKYKRWDGFKSKSLDVLSNSLDSALSIVNLANLKLEYWDRFNFDGPISDVEYKSLLRSDCILLPKFIFQMSELWHSHVGYFAKAKQAPTCLVNLNADAIDLVNVDPVSGPTSAPVPVRTVGFYSMAQFTFAEGTYVQKSTGLALPLDEMHTILKDVFGSVITPEAAQRISLDGRREE